MEQAERQCAGIDIAKDDFTVTFSVCGSSREISHLSCRTFANTPVGFKAFNKWLGKLHQPSIPFTLIMEATGVYHEKLAYFLHDLGYSLSVVLPKRAKDFSKTLKVKKVTDKIASQSLAIMGLERKLDPWQKPDKDYYLLKRLTREKDRIQGIIVELKNQIHAEKASAFPNGKSLKRLEQALKFLKKQKSEVVGEIKELIASNEQMKKKIEKVITLPGVGLLTVAAIIGETDGFRQIRNKRQLVSYVGLDIINQESGTSVKTRPRVSKRGNKRARKALHMPALSAIRHEERSKELFVRIVSKSGIKMKGVVAVQRKLLVLIYTLWKNDTEYDPNYEEKKRGNHKPPLELDQVRSLESN